MVQSSIGVLGFLISATWGVIKGVVWSSAKGVGKTGKEVSEQVGCEGNVEFGDWKGNIDSWN